MAPRRKAAPKHLSPESKRFFLSITEDYELEEHHLAILERACEAFDRMREAQAAIRADGAYVDGRFGLRAHPALAVERDSRLAYMRALRELGLDLDTGSSPRPPSPYHR